mmetsp:Transcript_13218/g.40640  ORF Transcript_13218/g.40640 Transcript_13218/m.40640 type:complete len:96 (+) Transcript_13218:644-931(+)
MHARRKQLRRMQHLLAAPVRLQRIRSGRTLHRNYIGQCACLNGQDAPATQHHALRGQQHLHEQAIAMYKKRIQQASARIPAPALRPRTPPPLTSN